MPRINLLTGEEEEEEAVGRPTVPTRGEPEPTPTPPPPPPPPPPERSDLYRGIEDLYKNYLKRTPNEQEVTGHLPNPGGLKGVETTILESPEYRALSGEKPPPTQTTSAYDASDPWHWFKQFTVDRGLPANSQTLASLESELAKYGVKVLKNASGIYGKIQLPDGTIVDVVRAAGAGGGGPDFWQWDTGGGTPGPGGGTPGGGVSTLPGWVTQLAGDQYNDPYTTQMEQLIKERMSALMQPYQNPYVDQYGNLLQNRIDQLQGNTPELQALIDSMNQRIASLGQMDDYAKQLTERNKQLQGTTESLQKLIDFANRRATDLTGPEYTGAQQEIFRTQALDPIERDRTAARERVMADLANRGLDLNSGISQAALNQVDRVYDTLRAQEQGSIASEQAASQSTRQNQAMQIYATLAEIPELRADQALAVSQALANYLTSREQEGIQLRGVVAEIPEQRANQSVKFANELASLSDLVTQRQDARAAETVALSGVLADLGPQRLQAALAALGQGTAPAGVFNSLAQLAQLQAGQQNLGIQANAASASALGTTLSYLFGNLLKQTTTPTGWTSGWTGMDAFAGVR